MKISSLTGFKPATSGSGFINYLFRWTVREWGIFHTHQLRHRLDQITWGIWIVRKGWFPLIRIDYMFYVKEVFKLPSFCYYIHVWIWCILCRIFFLIIGHCLSSGELFGHWLTGKWCYCSDANDVFLIRFVADLAQMIKSLHEDERVHLNTLTKIACWNLSGKTYLINSKRRANFKGQNLLCIHNNLISEY